MILLNEIKIKDFLSHEKTEINFGENDKILVNGRSGSGKSTITEAILWVLYGKGRSDNRSLIRRGTKSAAVSLKLNDGTSETLITRTVSGAGKNTLTVTQNTGTKGQFIAIERTGIKDIQDWIEKEYLKASFELFTNSVAYPQENENSFVKANASRRKDLLLEIVRAGNFEKLYEKTRKALATNEIDRAVESTKVTNLISIINDAKETAGKLDKYTKDLEKFSKEVETYSILVKDLEQKASNISGLAKQITDKKTMATMIEKSLVAIEEQRGRDAYIVEEHGKIDIEKAKKDVKEEEELGVKEKKIEDSLKDNAERQMKVNAHLVNKPKISDFTREIELINERLIPLVQQSGECPSGDKCPFVGPIKGQIAFLTQQIETKTNQNKREKQDMLGWEKVYASFAPLKDTTELYKELEEVKDKRKILRESHQIISSYNLFDEAKVGIKEREDKAQVDEVKHNSDLKVTREEIEKYEKDLASTNSNQINMDLASINISLQTSQTSKDEASAGIIVVTKSKEDAKKASEELSELQKGMSKAEEERKALELLKEALSPRGIKAVVIDYLVPQLEESINSILEQMSDFRIHLDTQQSKVKEEDGIKEGLFITVINDKGEEMAFTNYSGGEKVKVTTAISEALASLMSDIGFRIMDENIVSLDSESTDGFTLVLKQLQEKFPQLLVISHIGEVKEMFNNQIEIKKTNGVSKII
jgi:exonuclease SbcC